MALVGLPAAGTSATPGLAVAGKGGQPRAGRPGPVIVMTYEHAGGGRLQALLSGYSDLACTTGTGLLPLCEQAAAAWHQADGRPNATTMSPLAATSIRALASAMITAILTRTGGQRWCETASAQPDAAGTFMKLFPDTRFLCLHRACPGVTAAALQARPWGLSGPPFAPFTAAHPASTVAALAAYWTAQAGPLLAFEQAHRDACKRVLFEDLAADPDKTAADVAGFLGLDDPLPSLPDGPDRDDGAEGSIVTGPDRTIGGVSFPVGQIPRPLLAQVNNLHARLGYPPLQAGP